MLTIRESQLVAIERDARRRLCRQIVDEETALILASPADFPEVFPWTERAELAVIVARVVERGARDREVIRLYVRMAAALGFDFESRPDYGWLVTSLDDRVVTSPDERVRLAHAEWVRRTRLAAENARREEDFLRRCGASR